MIFVQTNFILEIDRVPRIGSAQGYFSIGNPDALIGIGMVDFAGSGVVHITGGSTALYATIILGARQGRFHDRNGIPLHKPGLTKGHSVALQMLGTFILFFGWFGFNPGSAISLSVENKGHVAALAAVTTTLAAAAGTVSCLLTNGIMKLIHTGEFQFDIVMAMNGCLSGLVSITASCSVVEPWAAVVIGVIAGWVYIAADIVLIHSKIDDAVAAIQVHFANGFWGVIAAGLFASPRRMIDTYGTDSHPGFFYAPTGANLLPAQLAGLLFIIGWTLLTTMPFFVLLDYLNAFRVNALEEIVGLDANYQNYSDGPNMPEDPSDENEEVRMTAYRLRFAERKKAREERVPANKTVDDVLNQSWGASQFDNADTSNDAGTQVGSVVLSGNVDPVVIGNDYTVQSVVNGSRQLTFKQWKKLQESGNDRDDVQPMSEQAPTIVCKKTHDEELYV
jgi:ammonium transporter, Amt family